MKGEFNIFLNGKQLESDYEENNGSPDPDKAWEYPDAQDVIESQLVGMKSGDKLEITRE